MLGQAHVLLSLHGRVGPHEGFGERRALRRVGRGVEPLDPGVAPEPRPLPAGEPAGAAHGAVDGVVEVDLAGHVGQQLAVAERLAGGARQPVRPGRQLPYLVDEPGGELGPVPLGDAARRPPRRAAARPRAGTGGGIGPEPGAEAGERPAGPDGHLEGAHDPPPVAGLHPAGRDGVERGQAVVQHGGVRLALQLGPDLGPPAGDGEAVDRGPQVQAGAADQQGPGARGARCRPSRRRTRLEAGHRELLGGVGQVEQVVGNLGALGRATASPSRRPSRGTPASSRPTRSRCRPAPWPGRARWPTSPMPSSSRRAAPGVTGHDRGGPSSITACTAAGSGWGPKPVRNQVAPAAAHGGDRHQARP